jgi:predicted dehydrogenase
MTKIKCAVVGAGYLGKFHAQKYATLPDCDLVAVVDVDINKAEVIAAQYGAKAYTDYREITALVDAASIVVPTTLHHTVAMDFLLAGVHLLVEKPVTVTIDEADELIALAKSQGVVLQVGHLERFNPAVLALDHGEKPLFIESHRLSPFNPRANDVNVVLDLMIHDIDIILAFADSELEKIDASGMSVFTPSTDIANVRLQFASGCVANVTASRISMKIERKMRLIRANSYVSIDFQNRVLTKLSAGTREMFPGVPEILTEESVFEDGDALMAEIRHFIECIHTGKKPLVSGEDGKKALSAALKISAMLAEEKITMH